MADVDLNDVAVFVRVVELGAFAKVAREMGVPTSTVSRTIARLEGALATTLLVRTTRSVQPTSEGQSFYDEAAPAIAALRGAVRGVEGSDTAPRGRLRVTAPNDIGSTFLAEAVVAFSALYPLVDVELILTNRRVDLVEERIDVAVRVGQLADSSMLARKIGVIDAGLYASPSYLRQHPAPRTLDDLDTHACVLFRPDGGEAEWLLRGPEGEVARTVNGRIGADDFLTVLAATTAGAGVGLLPHIVAAPELTAGRLQRVLPEYVMVGATMHVLHAGGRNVPAKVVVFRDFLVEAFRKVEFGPLPHSALTAKAASASRAE